MVLEEDNLTIFKIKWFVLILLPSIMFKTDIVRTTDTVTTADMNLEHLDKTMNSQTENKLRVTMIGGCI